jgi:hypothetical protein
MNNGGRHSRVGDAIKAFSSQRPRPPEDNGGTEFFRLIQIICTSNDIAPPYNGGHSLGRGQGLARLLQFSGILGSGHKSVSMLCFLVTVGLTIRVAQKLQLVYWEAIVREYFVSQAIMKFTLWRDNQRNEAKPFGWFFQAPVFAIF